MKLNDDEVFWLIKAPKRTKKAFEIIAEFIEKKSLNVMVVEILNEKIESVKNHQKINESI